MSAAVGEVFVRDCEATQCCTKLRLFGGVLGPSRNPDPALREKELLLTWPAAQPALIVSREPVNMQVVTRYAFWCKDDQKEGQFSEN